MGRGITKCSNRNGAMNHKGGDPGLVRGRLSAFSAQLTFTQKWLRANGHRGFSINAHTHDQRGHPALFDFYPHAEQRKLPASLSYPAQRFIFTFFYSVLRSPSVLFSHPPFALILLLTTLFSAGLAGCRFMAAPERGPFCWKSFRWN